MTNRIVLGALPGGGYGLRVSRPGYNVLDTGLGPQQLSFDSRWPTAARLHMEGTYSAAPVGNTTTYGFVSYGTTFAAPPPVLVLMTDANGGWRTTDWNYDGGGWQNGSLGIEGVNIMTNGMYFWHPLSGLPGGTRTYRYFVMRPL